MKIKSIKEVEYDGDVYNLRIKDNHNYFAEDICVSNCHLAKAATLTTILKRTFGHAYNRFGVSGTFPSDDSLEILTIQSVLGPNVTKIEASTLVESGTITPMTIKAVILNHANSDISEKLNYIKKMGAGSDAFRLEKEIIQSSDKRVEFIKKLVDKCDSTLYFYFTRLNMVNKFLIL